MERTTFADLKRVQAGRDQEMKDKWNKWKEEGKDQGREGKRQEKREQNVDNPHLHLSVCNDSQMPGADQA